MKLALVNVTQSPLVPPLGLVSNATYLVANHILKNNEIEIMDINLSDPLDGILKIKPDMVGISAMTVSFNQAIALAKKIKNYMDIPLIIGGVHISTHPQSFGKPFDIGVIGEGEQTLLELTECFLKYGEFSPDRLEGIPGVIFSDGHRIIKTNRHNLIEPLDRIPIPDRDFLSSRCYFKPVSGADFGLSEKIVLSHLLTSRGCPYKCVFCSTSIFWEKTRFYSPQRVADEISELIQRDKTQVIQVWDDMFIASKKRIERIMNELDRLNILGRVKFNIQASSNLIDEPMARLLKELGVVCVGFGFESGSERVLSYLKEGKTSVEENRNAVLLLDRYKIKIVGSFMLGSPKETIEDLKKTIEFMNEMAKVENVSRIWFGLTTPYPGTKLWDYAKELNIVNDKMDWARLDIMHGKQYITPQPFFLDKITHNEFGKYWQEAVKIQDRIHLRNRIKTLGWGKNLLLAIRLAMLKPYKVLSYMKEFLKLKREGYFR